MDLTAPRLRVRALLRLSGESAIVGLSANKTLWDWIWSGLNLSDRADRLEAASREP